MTRHEIHAYHEERDEWEPIPYRNSLWTNDGRVTGDVSASEEFYHVIQYGDLLETVGNRLERYADHTFEGQGHVSLSSTAHRMSATIDFQGGATVSPREDDPITLGLKVRSSHSGYHAVKYDVGAERQVCSNGMMAFSADLHFEQRFRGQPT